MQGADAETMPAGVLAAAVDHVMNYPFKVWGFGEDIALRALLQYSDRTGEQAPRDFVHDLVRRWCEGSDPLRPEDHVAPGVPLLQLFEATADGTFLHAAERLAALQRSFHVINGVPVHRPDHPTLGSLIWVDCMALDAPFLARWAKHAPTQEGWTDLAIRNLRAYATALLDVATGLFHHGFDVRTGERSPCRWARGNGWAMHGVVDTLEELPSTHPLTADLTKGLERHVHVVADLQDESGLWHTILDDPDSPLENSTAGLYASAVLKARRLGLLDATDAKLDTVIGRAISALLHVTRDDGGLPISYATPVGPRETYVDAPLGIFPWGQGPLILTFTELSTAPNADQVSAFVTPGSRRAQGSEPS